MVYNGSSQNSERINLYVNGQEVPLAYLDLLPVITPNNSFSLWIGGNAPDPYDAPFSGIIDDLIIYNRALSPSEIQQLYTAQSYAWNTGATTPTITVSPTTNTNYSCTVTQGPQTCSASVDITVNPQQTFYADADGDGFGDANNVVQDCNQPVGYVEDSPPQ
jgi:hypothetical protein